MSEPCESCHRQAVAHHFVEDCKTQVAVRFQDKKGSASMSKVGERSAGQIGSSVLDLKLIAYPLHKVNRGWTAGFITELLVRLRC